MNAVRSLPIANQVPCPVKGLLMVGEGAREITLQKHEVILDTADLFKELGNFGLIYDIPQEAIVNSLFFCTCAFVQRLADQSGKANQDEW